MKLLGNLEQGLVFVVSAPAGTGKTTLIERLAEEFPASVAKSISCTTRAPRKGEVSGRDYLFISEDEFDQHIKKDDFLEYAQVFDKRYGTLKSSVKALQDQGKHVILVIDTQGAESIRKKIEATYIFLLPPSIEALRNRLVKRNTDSIEVIEKRLSWAYREIEQAVLYDFQIINDDLEVAYALLKSICIAKEQEELSRKFKIQNKINKKVL